MSKIEFLNLLSLNQLPPVFLSGFFCLDIQTASWYYTKIILYNTRCDNFFNFYEKENNKGKG